MAHIGFDRKAFFSFAIVVLFAGLIFGGVYATTNFRQIRSQADTNNIATSLEVVNVTESTATIFWITNEPTTGYISYGETTALGRTKMDDREDDGDTAVQAYRSHLVSLSRLRPKAKYYYTIGIGDQTFTRDGFPFVFFTTAQPAGTPQTERLLGKVVTRDGAPAPYYFVTLTFENSSGQISNTVGALTERNGEYVIDTSLLRSADGTQIFPLANTGELTVDAIIHDEFGEISTQSFLYTAGAPLPVLQFNGSAIGEPDFVQSGGTTNSLLNVIPTSAPTFAPSPTATQAPSLFQGSRSLLGTGGSQTATQSSGPVLITPVPTPTPRSTLKLLL